MGRLEKTDRIDAGMIAWYAEVKQSPPVCLAPQSQQHLRALVTRLRQLTDIRTAQLNQQRLVTDRSVQASFAKLLAFVAGQIRDLEQRIAKLIGAGPAVAPTGPGLPHHQGGGRSHRVPRSWPRCRRSAPSPTRPSPSWREWRPWRATRASTRASARCEEAAPPVREILFIVASVVGRYEPDFIAFQQRLRAAGKPPKVVRIALAHKLLVRLNAKAREVRQRFLALQPGSSALLLATN